MTKRVRRSFSKEFKEQIVQLHGAGKPRSEILKEYELTPSAFDKWVRQHSESGSFEEKDNRTPEQEELIVAHPLSDQINGKKLTITWNRVDIAQQKCGTSEHTVS